MVRKKQQEKHVNIVIIVQATFYQDLKSERRLFFGVSEKRLSQPCIPYKSLEKVPYRTLRLVKFVSCDYPIAIKIGNIREGKD